jgi:hypothetical protein
MSGIGPRPNAFHDELASFIKLVVVFQEQIIILTPIST